MQISFRPVPVAIRYDTARGRTTKHFADAYAARRWYTAKDKAVRGSQETINSKGWGRAAAGEGLSTHFS